MRLTRFAALALAGLFGSSPPAGKTGAVELVPATTEAFQRYVHGVETTVEARANGTNAFLWADESPARLDRLRRGEVVAGRSSGEGPVEVEAGLIHDWIGAVFIPRVTLDQTLGLVQDYARHKDIYPEVVDSKLVSRQGDRFVILLRLKKKKVITAVLDTIHDAEYFRLDTRRAYSRSRTTRVAEVEDAGTRNEHEMAPGTGHGFMWFLNSYWRFSERDRGVYVECRAVSLSRDIPWGLGWLIGPVVNDLPRESLESTLAATRAALLKRSLEQSLTATVAGRSGTH